MEAGNSSLQKEIHHPAHGHSGALTLTSHRGTADSLCSICGDFLGGCEPIYRCPDPDCDFKLDLRCSSIKSVIEFEAHRQHPLCFIEKYGPGVSCRWCQQSKDPDLPMFRCGECGFSLHLLCGPLPRAIRHKNYELTFTDCVIEGTGPDDCWCHICEEKRDPGKCVYHSPEIPFTASIKCCLLPQIKNLLKGDLGDVELRTAGGHILGKVISRIQVEDCSQPFEARPELYGDDVVQEAEYSSKTSSSPLEEEEEFSAEGETSMQFMDTPVSTDSDEGTVPNRAETELYGDEVVQEADSSSEPYSDQVDGEEEFSAEMEDVFGNFLSGFAEGLLESLAEASKELMDILGSSDSVKPKKGKSKTYRDEGTEEAGTSTAAAEWIRGLSLDSYQFLRSLDENEADEFEDLLNANAKLIGKSKATGNFPLDDAAQKFREQLDISHLEEDVQLNKSQSRTGDEEELEELHLTYVQMMRKITPQDIQLINEAFAKCTKHGEEGKATWTYLYYSNSRPLRTWEFSYSDDAFKKFKEQIDITDRVDNSYLTGWKKYAAKIVRVGNNLIPSQFVSIYREMVDKYGDFSAGSELSPVAKAIFFHLLFAVIYSMRGAQVHEINDDLLCTWQYYFRGVQNAGFNIQFALDNLEKLVRAYFGFKVTKFRDETTKKLGKQQEKLQREMDEKEAKLELLKSIHEKYREPKEAEDSMVKQCLIEAAKWKWKDAGDLVL